jgi:hypothetical protein
MSTNTDAIANQDGDGGSGEFKPRIAPDEPMTKKGVSITAFSTTYPN